MRNRKITFICTLVISCFPFVAQATDITIYNKTDAYGTAKLDLSPCSSMAGSGGVIQPQGNMTVSLGVISGFCWSKTCIAHLYATNDCSGTEISKVTVSTSKGVTKIENLDEAHYFLTGGGTSVTLNAATTSWTNWLNWFK